MTLSPALKLFIRQHIHSVEEVEVLIFLRKGRDKEWLGIEISNAMTSSISSVGKRLADLCAVGLLECIQRGNETRYKFRPLTPAHEDQIDELARIYPVLRLTIIQFIFEAPIEKIRNFADAFKLKGDEDHG